MSEWLSITGFKGIEISPGNIDLQLKEFSKYMEKVEVEAGKYAREKMREIAEKFRESLKQVILFQSLKFAPLSESYAKRKDKLGLDPRILIATGEYVESIEIIEEENTKGLLTLSVIHEDRNHSESKINLRLLARVLEFGSNIRNIPSRPHWRPVMQEFIQMKDILANETIEYVSEKIRQSLELKKMK